MNATTSLMIFVALPYLAVGLAIVGTVFRFKKLKLTVTAKSSQVLEDKGLRWGSWAWHLGILSVLLGHGVALLFPSLWAKVVKYHTLLVSVEIAGMACATAALVALLVLLVRRVLSKRVQAVTTTGDFLLLVILIFQVALGLGTAVGFPWGAAWTPGTLSMYLRGLFIFQPRPELMADFPLVIQAHVVGAFLLVLIFPFTRLPHMLLLPLQYLFRPFQKVVWNNPRRQERPGVVMAAEEGRRKFLTGALGVTAGGVVLAAVGGETAVRYAAGGKGSSAAENRLLKEKLERMEVSAEYRRLELERRESPLIPVAGLKELEAKKGRYFIDYAMAPGLVFLGADGYPLLISAKCTHLGCTVGKDLDAQGRLLCPCHISYFDVKTGKPDPGAPAKAPLAHLEWVVVDAVGKVVAKQDSKGVREGQIDPKMADQLRVCIPKPRTGGVA